MHGGVQAPDDGFGAHRRDAGGVGEGVRSDSLDDRLWAKQDARDASKGDGGLTSAERDERAAVVCRSPGGGEKSSNRRTGASIGAYRKVGACFWCSDRLLSGRL